VFSNFLEYWTMDKVEKAINSECYAPSSEPIRMYISHLCLGDRLFFLFSTASTSTLGFSQPRIQWVTGWGSIPRRGRLFIFATASRPTLGFSQLRVQWAMDWGSIAGRDREFSFRQFVQKGSKPYPVYIISIEYFRG
jgi:hypothetical protein